MKKCLAWVLAALMLLASIPAMAENTRTSGLYTYSIKGNGTICITHFDWSQNTGDIFVPTMIDGYTVSEIGSEAFYSEKLRRTSSSLRYLDNFDTVSLTLPESVKSIGEKAFWNATLSAINIPQSVQSIGVGAFVGNPTIQFKIVSTHPYFAVIDDALYSKARKELIAYPKYSEVSTLGKNAELTIPEGILSIADYAFYRGVDTEKAQYISSDYYSFAVLCVTYPSTLETIGAYAFYGMRFDRNAPNPFPEQLKTIGEYAYAKTTWYCGDELQITIPAGTTRIGQGAFSNLEGVYGGSVLHILPDSRLSAIEDSTFMNCGLTVSVEATGIQSIGDYAFSGVWTWSLADTSAIISLGKYAFGQLEWEGDKQYASYSYPYDQAALEQLEGGSLLTFNFPPQVDTIPEGFFLPIEIPSTVKRIESGAFWEVTDFKLPDTLTSIAPDAFRVGSTFVVDAGSYAELWCSENGFAYSLAGADNLDWLN